MANAKEIQERMKSIQDTMKITSAMYMISSAKLRSAKQKLDRYRTVFLFSAGGNLPTASSYSGCKQPLF